MAAGSDALDQLIEAETVDARDGALSPVAIHDLFLAPTDLDDRALDISGVDGHRSA